MRKLVLVVALAAVGCGNKKDGGSPEKSVEVEKALQCKAGEVIENAACKLIVTVENVKMIAAQESRLDELGKLLDKVDAVSAPIEIVNAFRKLNEWQTLTGKFDQLKVVDGIVGDLDNAVKTLRTFRASLDQAETRLGNLRVEIEKLMTDTGASKKIEDVRASVSEQLRATLEPLAAQVSDTITNALQPLIAKMEQIEALIDIGCGGLKLSGGSDDAKKLCDQAKVAFVAGRTYLADLKDRPAKLYTEVSAQLEKELDGLLDSASKQAIEAAQTKVNELLKLPPGAQPAKP